MHLIAVVPHILLQNRALAWCCQVESPHVMLQKCTLIWSVLTFCSNLVLSFGASSGLQDRGSRQTRKHRRKQHNAHRESSAVSFGSIPWPFSLFVAFERGLTSNAGLRGAKQSMEADVHAHTKFRGLPKKRPLRTHGWRPSFASASSVAFVLTL